MIQRERERFICILYTDRGRQVEMDNSTVAGSIPHKLTDPSVTATNNKLHHTVMFQTISPLAILILNSRGNKRSDCDVQAMQDVNGHKSENGQNGQNGLATDQPHKVLFLVVCLYKRFY